MHLLLSKSYLGASSEGLVLCSNVDTLCREVKCPYSIEKCITIEMTPSEIASKFSKILMVVYTYDTIITIMHKYRVKSPSLELSGAILLFTAITLLWLTTFWLI